ncbi:MAG: hypothetical protein RR067_05970 [Bacilli bacterium]
MMKDINIFLDDEKIDYKYENKYDKIIISLKIDNMYKNLDIVYDENVYENIISKGTDFEQLKSWKIRFNIDKVSNCTSKFEIKINYKYFIKSIYKFINGFINKNTLLTELEIFKNSVIGRNYKKQIESLINEIDMKSISDLLLENNDENDRIKNLLLKNNLYLFFAKKMTNRDLMLLITYYICCPNPPKINQDMFNDLVNEAINYDNGALENVWRLGMSYDDRGYNFDLLDIFFVNSKDSWYLAEYISSISQVDQEKIVKMIIETKDKEFIEKILEDNFIQSNLEEKYQKNLTNYLEI